MGPLWVNTHWIQLPPLYKITSDLKFNWGKNVDRWTTEQYIGQMDKLNNDEISVANKFIVFCWDYVGYTTGAVPYIPTTSN